MCGILGILKKNKKIKLENLELGNKMIQHRGPNASSYYVSNIENLALAHCRLSILDLSDSANQPFHSHCGRYVMVYNGEIYNYREIANKYNIVTKTTSDTEVILESFAQNGTQCVSDFNGMFALAIWDKKEEILYLFRDRLGIKPLFTYQESGQFAFASELKALKALSTNFSINYDAIASFLHLGYIPHPMTIYQECKKFPAGYYGIYKNGKLEIKPYWSIEEKIEKEVVHNESNAKKELEKLLLESVKKRMISDVPLGTFLSGGIDSSIVTAIAQYHSTNPIKTFSIGFKESKFNEAIYAKSVADHLGTEHHEFILSEKNAIERVDQLLNIYDEPFADSSAIPTLLVSQMARQEVTVCLSGDGGDELFMGYGMYNWAKRLNHPIFSTFRKPLSWGLKTFGDNRIKRGAAVFDYPSGSNLKTHLFSQEQGFFSLKEIRNLLTVDAEVKIKEDLFADRLLNPMEQQSFFDLKHYLKDDLLVKVDRASMFHSLEVRVPLLDHKIVEFALNLGSSLKCKKGIQKYLLKQVLFDFVPSEIFDRPKWGFSIPLASWLKKDLNYLIDKYLSPDSLKILDETFVTNLIKRFNEGEDYLYNRVWNLILLQKWLVENE